MDGETLLGLLAVHVRVNVFEGATSIPEYTAGVTVVLKVGSVMLNNAIGSTIAIRMERGDWEC